MSDARPTIKVGDLFTEMELREAVRVYEETGSAKAITDQVVTDEVLARIDKKTGQQNNRDYLGYVLEFAMLTIQKRNLHR